MAHRPRTLVPPAPGFSRNRPRSLSTWLRVEVTLDVVTTYNTAMQRASFADIPSDVHGLISKRTAEMDGVAVTEVTFDVGAVWSKDLKPDVGTTLCELPHVAVVVNGAIGVRMQDGTKETFAAGDVMMLPPGHDAWCIGEEPCIFIEFSRGNDYYV